MKRFAQLFSELDATTKTNSKVAALVRYFGDAPPADAAWAVFFLGGARPKRLLGPRKLAAWAMEASGIADWLFEECYHAVGDLAETIALLLPPATAPVERSLDEWMREHILALATMDEPAQRDSVRRAWTEVDGTERFLLDKVITGELRVGVSHNLVVRALAQVSGIEDAVIAHRLTGTWSPSAAAYEQLVSADTRDTHISQPYPFYLAHPLDDELDSLGSVAEWQIEWKWDGIRGQLIRRADQIFLWSRGEELVTPRFPEIASAASGLPNGTVLDGEIMTWRGGPLPFAQLQRRIGRLKLTPAILAEVPVAFIVYDLLELGGEDVRDRPLAWRRAELERLIASSGAEDRLIASPIIAANEWADARRAFAESRQHNAEGLMLKRRDSAYGVGRRRGAWWKWKNAPFTVDAVLVYAQPGHGRRATLYTDYTFAVWHNGTLVPFAKAYSGLTDAEIRQLDSWIRRNTIERFGPVRSVTPVQVFELAFEGIQPSPRHKSGIAVRFPRILRWRTDKAVEEADTLATLERLMERA